MVEQKLFGKSKETNCDIMFLVRRDRHIRLMSFKTNPWLSWSHLNGDTGFLDPDIEKQALFLFSGELRYVPDEYKGETDIPQNAETMKRFCRRFSSDKIQNAQLITKTMGSCEQYMMIM